MTPSLPDILRGQAAALTTPLPPEAGQDYMVGRFGLLAMLAQLAAQEAERGPAACAFENRAMAELLQSAGATASLTATAETGLSDLDTLNAQLRRDLIALHVDAEARGDRPLQTRILELYRRMAGARRLELGG